MPRKEKNPRRRAAEQFLVRCSMTPLSLLIRCLPLRALRRLAAIVAAILLAVLGGRKRLMYANLRAVFGDEYTEAQLREIGKKSVANITKTMGELIKLQWMTDEELMCEVSAEGREHLDAALARGKGAILISAHFGNWEYVGALASLVGYPVNVIARDPTDPFTRDLINNARSSKGIKIYGRRSARRFLKALKDNECVAILPDQHAAEAAVRGTFLGRPADTATGPALLALRTGAALVPGFGVRGPDDHVHCVTQPEIEVTDTGDRDADVRAITQRINDVIGEQIRAHPEQWLWLHDRWKAEAQDDADAA